MGPTHDAGAAKGEHGGFHEAMIGAGICGGPLNAGVYAVTALLVAGFGGLIWLRLRKAG